MKNKQEAAFLIKKSQELLQFNQTHIGSWFDYYADSRKRSRSLEADLTVRLYAHAVLRNLKKASRLDPSRADEMLPMVYQARIELQTARFLDGWRSRIPSAINEIESGIRADLERVGQDEVRNQLSWCLAKVKTLQGVVAAEASITDFQTLDAAIKHFADSQAIYLELKNPKNADKTNVGYLKNLVFNCKQDGMTSQEILLTRLRQP
ncbi:MAG: hypothetical protein NT051_02125 [Candidatus Micrarchaeota archaeon]|nr:hypothetical protein [Candidatus Micrarchaeota archaeon]